MTNTWITSHSTGKEILNSTITRASITVQSIVIITLFHRGQESIPTNSTGVILKKIAKVTAEANYRRNGCVDGACGALRDKCAVRNAVLIGGIAG